MRPHIVGLSGGLSRPSRTLSLVSAVTNRIAQVSGGYTTIVDVAALPEIGNLRARVEARPEVEAAFRAVEGARLLVVGSPVYKGSYSGLFKHFVDFIDSGALVGTPVALLASGGSDRHALVVEHQLRPLFAFFQAQPLGTGLFVTEREIVGGELEGDPLRARLARLVDEAAAALRADSRLVLAAEAAE